MNSHVTNVEAGSRLMPIVFGSVPIVVVAYSVALLLVSVGTTLGPGSPDFASGPFLPAFAFFVVLVATAAQILLLPAIWRFRQSYLAPVGLVVLVFGAVSSWVLLAVLGSTGDRFADHLIWLVPALVLVATCVTVRYVRPDHSDRAVRGLFILSNALTRRTDRGDAFLKDEERVVSGTNRWVALIIPLALSAHCVVAAALVLSLIGRSVSADGAFIAVSGDPAVWLLWFLTLGIGVVTARLIRLNAVYRARSVVRQIGFSLPLAGGALALLVLAGTLLIVSPPPLSSTLAFLIATGIGISEFAIVGLFEIVLIQRWATKIGYGYRYMQFWNNTAWILRQYPQPREIKGYVFVHTQTCVYTISSLILVLCRLRQQGWAIVVVDRLPISVARTGRSDVDSFFAYPLGKQMTMHFDWRIDWSNGVVEARGINLYHPIWEGLGRHFGRYFVDIREPNVADIFRKILLVADSTLRLCFRIYNTVAVHGKPVRIVGGSGQFVPNAVFNIFCREISKVRNMHFVWLQQGYQTYYNDKALLSDRVSLENMTRAWPYSNPYLAHKSPFEKWVAAGQDVPAIMAEAREWIGADRAGSRKIPPEAQEIYDRIVAHRANGGKVICLLGKILFDLSTPWDRGPAHANMHDWLNHSIDCVRGADDVLLLIKPHPYEARKEISGHIEQCFSDMIETEVPRNAILLAHHWFNLHALIPVTDLGVLWNGTSGLELGVNGMPAIMCSDWGPIDYPIGFLTPKDREDYRRMLRNPGSLTMPNDYVERCAMLLKYTSTDEVMIPYDYCARPLTNAPFGPPIWYMDRVKRFIQEGDPHIDYAATKFH